MRLNRGQKTLRNLLLCFLLGLAVYGMLGLPPYTVRGMLEDAERRYLLSDLEPVLVERDKLKYSNDLFPWHTTWLLARSGNTYLWTSYTRHLLEVYPEYHGTGQKLERSALCAARDGTLYIAGDFTGAASAEVEVTVERVTQVVDPETQESEITIEMGRTFTYAGEKISSALFTCRYREGERIGRIWYGQIPEKEYGLEEAARSWYRCYVKGDTNDGFAWVHADLPVKVTLYDAAGQVLNVLELSVDTYELGDTF